MLTQLLYRRMVAGGLLLGVYGVYIACVRLPSGLGLGTLVISSMWALAIFPALGMVAAGGAALLAITISRPITRTYRAAPAAIIETACLIVLLVWLLLNEIVYATTSEVVGYATLCMVWHEMAATFQVAWAMGARYLITIAVVGVIAATVLFRITSTSYRQVWPGQESATAGRPVRRFGMAGSMGLPLVVALLLTWQFNSPHTEALAVLFRSAPPLKALNLTRALVGGLESPPSELAGPAIISDEAYADSMDKTPATCPNVILFVLESVPARALHCYGYPRPGVSPNMDALAAEGVRFEHCWSTASFSSYGLVSIMTSLYLLRGEHNDHFSDFGFPHMSLPRAFKLAGYETAIFSSGNESFDNINQFCRPADFDRYYTQDTCGLQLPDCMRMDDRYAIEEFERWLAERSNLPTREDAGAAPGEANVRGPFYCSFYLQSTHFNYEVPEPWNRYYQPTPPTYSNGDGIIHIPPEVLPKLRNQYDNALRYLDYWVGRVRADLEEAGEWDNTVVAIIGDHGEGFMEHGLARHGTHLWEELIHVPLIVYLGKNVRESLPQQPRSTVPDTVSGLDVAPTLAALAGILPHPSWQGHNILAPEYTSRDRPVFSLLQLTRWQEAVCLNKLKYIYDLTEARAYLFDLSADPAERNDLTTLAPDLAAAMRELLGACHARQLAYYAPANRPITFYLEPYVPSAELLEKARRYAKGPR